jgi:hypothetical protein
MIPKIIHNIWIQGYEDLPEKNKLNHIQIKKLNPDWDFIIWDNKMILQLLKKYPSLLNLYKKVNQLSGIIHSKATQSDIARYVILKEFGGLYYDLDYECVSPLGDLFSSSNDTKETVYIASSKIEFLDYLWPLGNFISLPMYCSCFMAFPKNHPVWDKVFKKIEKTTSKYVIGHAVDQILQESEYPIILLDRVYGQYVCSNVNKICFTPVESSWNPIRPFLRFLNCYYKKIILIILVFLIIFIVERVNHFNIIKFGLATFIPGLPPPSSQQQQQQQQPLINPVKISKKNKSKK